MATEDKDQKADPDYRYRYAKLDGGGWGVFVEYDQGSHAGWWRLIAEFQNEQRASDYAEFENHQLATFFDESFERGDERLPENLPDIPPSGIVPPKDERARPFGPNLKVI